MLGNVTATDLNFDLAVLMYSLKAQSSLYLDETYFSLEFAQYKITDWTTVERIPLPNPYIPCNSTILRPFKFVDQPKLQEELEDYGQCVDT